MTCLRIQRLALLPLLLLLASAAPAIAQYPIGIGGTGGEFVSALAVDGAGNTYAGGYFTGTVDFDPGAGTTELTASSSSGTGFLASYDHAGALRWAFNLGGRTITAGLSDGGPNDIEIGPGGHVYVTGSYSCSGCDFDPGAATVSFPNGTYGVFVASYTSDGQFRYALPIDNVSERDLPGGLVVDGLGGVTVTGSFKGAVDFDPGVGDATLGTAGGTTYKVFVASYDTNGAYSSAFMLNSSAAAEGQDIGRDAAGNITIVGGFVQTLDLDPGAGTVEVTPRGNNEDTFVASYTPSGAFRWGHTVGGDTNRGFGADVAVDASGLIYVAGPLWGSADFDPGPNVAQESSAGLTDAFVVSYDASGGFRHVFLVGSSGNDGAQDIALDSEGNTVLTGTFFGTIDLDPGAGATSISSNGISDMFTASYGDSGAFLRGFSIGGSGLDGGTVVATGRGSTLAIGGYFGDEVDFDPAAGQAQSRTSAGGSDGFVALYDASGIILVPNENDTPGSPAAISLTAYPNPVRVSGVIRLLVSTSHPTPLSVVVFDALGRRVSAVHDAPVAAGTAELKFNANGLAPGSYFVLASDGETVLTQPMTVVR